MTKPNYINFKLKDPFETHTNVNVAGTFNNWDPNADALAFDTESKDWCLDLDVDLPVDHKVMYKYVVDENKWICDVSAPLEKDADGNENNVTFVILKNKTHTGSKTGSVRKEQKEEREQKQKREQKQEQKQEDSKADSVAGKLEQQEEEEEVFDHKSFHENELFDASEQGQDETAPTSGEENNHEADAPLEATTHDIQLATTGPKKGGNDIPKPNGGFSFASLWESIAWFFKYYILSWFYPEH